MFSLLFRRWFSGLSFIRHWHYDLLSSSITRILMSLIIYFLRHFPHISIYIILHRENIVWEHHSLSACSFLSLFLSQVTFSSSLSLQLHSHSSATPQLTERHQLIANTLSLPHSHCIIYFIYILFSLFADSFFSFDIVSAISSSSFAAYFSDFLHLFSPAPYFHLIFDVLSISLLYFWLLIHFHFIYHLKIFSFQPCFWLLHHSFIIIFHMSFHCARLLLRSAAKRGSG